MKPSYPKDVLVAAAAKIYYTKAIDEWESKFTVPLEEYVVNTGEMYNSYCYPECSEQRNQIECRLLDPTQTNMRCHCTKKDMENSLSSAILEVSKSDNDILPRSIITPMIDKQSAVIAMSHIPNIIDFGVLCFNIILVHPNLYISGCTGLTKIQLCRKNNLESC